MRPEVLEVLVGTATDLLLLRIERSSLRLLEKEVIHRGQGFYFGITYDSAKTYVLCRNYARDNKHNSIVVFDNALKQIEEIELKGAIREGHQMFLRDQALFICNTNKNCVSRFNLQDASVQDFYPIPKRKNRNLNHINSICLKDSSVFLVAANRFRNSFILELDLETFSMQAIDSVGLQAHNILPTSYGHIICDSFHGSVVVWNTSYSDEGLESPMYSVFLIPDENEIFVEEINQKRVAFRERRGGPIFPRGLALTDDLLLVGLSEWGKGTARLDSAGRLMLIDEFSKTIKRNKSKNISTLDLGATGAVMEVRVVNALDEGHPLSSGITMPR